jgi:predicted ATPase/DNA-binding winged helix-turn-helix (wHTH) protein
MLNVRLSESELGLDHGTLIDRITEALEDGRSRRNLPLRDGFVDLIDGVVYRSEKELKLKPKELELLLCLLDAGARTVTRGEIMVDVWGYRPDALTKTLDVTMSTLRGKIELDPGKPEQLKTVRGKGYRLISLDEVGIPRHIETNVRVPRNQFVGREEVMLKLAGWLRSDERPLTLVGPGGVGKTRLALELALRVCPEFTGGVWLLDLSDARDLDDVVAAIASTLGLRLVGEDPSSAIGRAMRGYGRALWIVDNFEQIIDFAPVTVRRWQNVAFESSFVVTSRRPLLLESETLVHVQPITHTPGAVHKESAAVHLFCARAFGPDRQADLCTGEIEAIRSLVTLLEGMPLAIELAAARARLLPVSELLVRLQDDFRVLTSRIQDKKRHASLDASVRWTWDMLEPWKQCALKQCTIFASRFSVSAAEEVIDFSRWDTAPPVLDALDILVDEHMLVRSKVGGPGRLEYMELVRRFVTNEISADEELIESARLRHAIYFARYGDEPYLPRLRMAYEKCQTALLSDHLSALEFCESKGHLELALANGRAALRVYEVQGPVEKALEMARRLFSIAGSNREWQMRIAIDLASITTAWSTDADADLVQSIEIARQASLDLDDQAFRGAFWAHEALVALSRSEFDTAHSLLDNALELLLLVESWSWVTFCLANQGWLYFTNGDLDAARTSFHSALALEDRNNADQNGFLQLNLAVLAASQADYTETWAHYQKAIDYFEESGEVRYAQRSRRDRAWHRNQSGDSDLALVELQQVHAYFERSGDSTLAWLSAVYMFQVHLSLGHSQHAVDGFLRLLDEMPKRLPTGLFLEVVLRADLVIALTRVGRDDEAGEVLERAYEIVEESQFDAPELTIDLGLAQAELQWSLGLVESAEEKLAEVEGVITEIGQGMESLAGQKLRALRDRLEQDCTVDSEDGQRSS